MKSSRIMTESKPLPYPKLMVNINDSNIVVMFYNKTSGMIVLSNSNIPEREIGYHTTLFVPTYWEDTDIQVKLHN